MNVEAMAKALRLLRRMYQHNPMAKGIIDDALAGETQLVDELTSYLPPSVAEVEQQQQEIKDGE